MGKETGSEKSEEGERLGTENCLSLEAQAYRGTSESWLSKPPGTHLGSAEDSMIRT